VVFVADAFGAWLVEQLADAGRKKLTELLLGGEQERVLRRAADAAVWATAEEMSPSGAEKAGQVAMVISEVFRGPVPGAPAAGPVMLLESLKAGIAGQLAVLDDAELTGTGQSSADVLGVPGTVLAERLIGHLVQEIIVRGSAGGPLTPLADQLNHELTRLQIGGMLAQLAGEVQNALARPDSHVTVAGWPLDEVIDPFVLEVHRPLQPEEAPPGLPVLPPYVPREHDRLLAQVVRAATEGSSGIAVLVGGSSVGKTRACWETLAVLRGQDPPWRLWHPIDPSRPDAALRELAGIGPRTVVWLNEAQFYLDTVDAGLGERVAAGLRELLRDRGQAPVLVLATMWPGFWDALTARPADGDDRHAQARELLAGHDITVPAAFTDAELRQLGQMADTRLAAAATGAQDGQVIQYLAGVPELLAHYRNAPPAASALIHAAMDARRFNMRPDLPRAFLEAAAPGYITDPEWDLLAEDWSEQAFSYAARPCKGVRGPLTRPRSTRPIIRSGDSLSSSPGKDPGYRLADYLDQVGRRTRREQIPPTSFWTAAAKWAHSEDLGALGHEARRRGLYRDTAQLYKNAVAYGDPFPASDLIYIFEVLSPAAQLPRRWVVSHIALHNLDPVTWLFGPLRRAGAEEDFITLADRAVAHCPVDNPEDVAELLEELQEAGAQEQVSALLRRDPARQVAVHDEHAVLRLLNELVRLNAQEQAKTLAYRAAAYVTLDEPGRVATLLENFWKRHVLGYMTILLDRNPAAHVALDDGHAVAKLLHVLKEAGAEEQITSLANRIATDAPLHSIRDVATLMSALRAAGAREQLRILINRDPATHVLIDDAWGLGSLVEELRHAGASEQITRLLERNPAAHVPLGGLTLSVTTLLDSLQAAGAVEQVRTLADRAAAAPPLSDLELHRLLNKLRELGQASMLLNRNPATFNSLQGVALVLLTLLEQGGTQQQVAALADYATVAPIDNPRGAAWLLHALLKAGARTQASVLADHAASTALLDDPSDLAILLNTMREGGFSEQLSKLLDRDPAAHTPLDHAYHASKLLEALQKAGAQEQVEILIGRLPGEGSMELFEQEDDAGLFHFGREPDGNPTPPWSWEDLD
jgi:hypothetical protein